jgi:hypothetical protein
MIKSLVHKIRHELDGFIFLVRNVVNAFYLPIIPLFRFTEYTFRGMYRSEVLQVDQIQGMLRNGKKWNNWRKIMYYLFGSRLVIVAQDKYGRILGFQLLYFRSHEVSQRMLHEAFIGILPEYRGLKLSQHLRKYSIRHFMNTPIRAITSQINIENTPSIKSALASGGQLVGEHNGNAQILFEIK